MNKYVSDCCQADTERVKRKGSLIDLYRCRSCGQFCLLERLDDYMHDPFKVVRDMMNGDMLNSVPPTKDDKVYGIIVEGGNAPTHWHITMRSARCEAERLAKQEGKPVTIVQRLETISTNVTFSTTKW